MIGFVIGKCLVMADSDLFIICRQQAPDTENPIWITQLIRISQTGSGNNKFEQRKNVFDNTIVNKTPCSKEARDGQNLLWKFEAYFSQLTPNVRITTQSDLYQANLTESHRTWLNLAERPSYIVPNFPCHHFPCLYAIDFLLEFFDNIL